MTGTGEDQGCNSEDHHLGDDCKNSWGGDGTEQKGKNKNGSLAGTFVLQIQSLPNWTPWPGLGQNWFIHLLQWTVV